MSKVVGPKVTFSSGCSLTLKDEQDLGLWAQPCQSHMELFYGQSLFSNA